MLKTKFKKYGFFLLFIGTAICLAIYFFVTVYNKNYNFTGKNNDFYISGQLHFETDKRTINITKIKYLKQDVKVKTIKIELYITKNNKEELIISKSPDDYLDYDGKEKQSDDSYIINPNGINLKEYVSTMNFKYVESINKIKYLKRSIVKDFNKIIYIKVKILDETNTWLNEKINLTIK